MKKAAMLGKKSNKNSDHSRPAIDFAMLLIDIRKDAAEQDAQKKPEFSSRKKIAEEKEESYARKDVRVEEHERKKEKEYLKTAGANSH